MFLFKYSSCASSWYKTWPTKNESANTSVKISVVVVDPYSIHYPLKNLPSSFIISHHSRKSTSFLSNLHFCITGLLAYNCWHFSPLHFWKSNVGRDTVGARGELMQTCAAKYFVRIWINFRRCESSMITYLLLSASCVTASQLSWRQLPILLFCQSSCLCTSDWIRVSAMCQHLSCVARSVCFCVHA